jgi:hypothetical protein
MDYCSCFVPYVLGFGSFFHYFIVQIFFYKRRDFRLIMSIGAGFASISSYLPRPVLMLTSVDRCDEYEHSFVRREASLIVIWFLIPS